MLTCIFIGLALGAIYALAAGGLVVTYQSAGILNFAFGSMAFFVAKLFYWENQTHNWNLALSAVLALAVVAPLMGVVLYVMVFRFLRTRSTLIKVISSVGVSVALPALAIVLFGNPTISQAPGLAPVPVKYWHVLGGTLTLDQVIVYAFLVVVVGIGTVITRFTDTGLKIRALVNSEALTSLSGVNPNRLALGVWAVSGLLAGAAGVMAGPTVGVSVSSMTLLMASAFAAVVAARLRNLVAAVVVALLMGVVTDLIQYWLPSNSAISTDIVQCVPFVLIVVFLLYYLIRGDAFGRESQRGGALDAAIRAESGESSTGGAATPGAAGLPTLWYAPRRLVSLIPLVFMLFLPEIFTGYWLGLVARGIALAVIFLSFSLVTGDGGMIWLCQITFAGGGGLIAAEFSYNQGINPILAAVIGAAIMVPVGVLIGALTIRLGDLYVALVTLTFGLLVDQVVFTRTQFNPGLGGVPMNRPSFAVSDQAFANFALIVFLIVGLLVVNLRRSSSGLAVSAIRWSEPAARTLGLKVVPLKLLLSGIAAFVAGLGGAMLSMYDQSTDPVTYATFNGVIWLAVLVTNGIRSITATLLAGLSFMLLPAVFSTYTSDATWLQVPSVLFGLGAIGLAANPEGIVAMQARFLRDLVFGKLLKDAGLGTPVVVPALGYEDQGAVKADVLRKANQ